MTTVRTVETYLIEDEADDDDENAEVVDEDETSD